MSEIVDLILPENLTQMQLELKIYEAIEKYLLQNNRSWCESSIIDNIDALKIVKDKVIAENKSKYDIDFWLNVERLNRKNMLEINKILLVSKETILLEDIENRIDCYSKIRFKHNEIDLINKQYRLLQEIFCSRLEAKNEWNE